MNKSKYSIIYHDSIPDKLLVLEDDNNIKQQEIHEMKCYWKNTCKLYNKNPNHHFRPFLGMSQVRKDKYIQVTEIINKWDDMKSSFHIYHLDV